MKIVISGGNGFIGTAIQNHNFIGSIEFGILDRSQSDDIWKQMIVDADVVINLAGAPIIRRWSRKYKQTIVGSRINITSRIVQILNELPANITPRLFISASAIGIYPDSDDTAHDEFSNTLGNTFLSGVVKQWENEAKKLQHPAVRLVIPRIGVVLGEQGGLMKKTLPLFKRGLGGKISSGNQAISFIHIDDLMAAIQFFIQHKNAKGIYNLVAPINATNLEFTKAMGNSLKRLTLLTVPAFVLKMVYGEAARLMIYGEKVIPKKLIDEGFVFQYPTIEAAIQSIISEQRHL